MPSVYFLVPSGWQVTSQKGIAPPNGPKPSSQPFGHRRGFLAGEARSFCFFFVQRLIAGL